MMIFLRKSYEIVGYANTEDGYYICLSCIEEDEKENFKPLFLSDEYDYIPSCDRCFSCIEGNIIKNTLEVDNK